jgi:tripartite-type tricarboxylate transporter receptor subunit TctC
MKKLLLVFLAVSMVISLSFGEGQAENISVDSYPSKPITLMLGFSAGGSSDLLCRILADQLKDEIGQPVAVVNKTGGGGFIAWTELVNRVEPDGYTFALINTPNIAAGKYDKANPREINHHDMDVLANHVTDYNVIACRSDETRFTDMASFIQYAKNNEVLVGSSSTGIMSDDDTIAQRLNKQIGTKIVTVVTKGAKDNETYLLNKSTDILIGNVSDVLTGKKNNVFKVMTVFAPKRVSLMSDIPTAEELGIGTIYGNSSRGYALPKGVDPEIREKLLAAIERSIKSAEVIKALEDMGAETNFLKNEEYSAFIDEALEIAKDIYNVQ